MVRRVREAQTLRAGSLATLPPMDRFDLALHGQTVSVAFSLPGCEALLWRLFRRHAVGPLTTSPDIVVASTPEGALIERDGRRVSVALEDLAPELEHVVTQTILDSLPGLLHLHGAAVVGRAGAVVALGPSGSGKSTVAACWTISGRPILGDDVVFLDGEGTLHPLMKPLKVDAKRADALGLALDDTVGWEPGAPEAWVDPELHGGWGDPSPIAGLVLLERVPGPAAADHEPLVQVLPAPEGVQAVLGQLMTTGGRPATWIDPILELVDRVGVRRLRFSDSQRVAELLATLADRPLNG